MSTGIGNHVSIVTPLILIGMLKCQDFTKMTRYTQHLLQSSRLGSTNKTVHEWIYSKLNLAFKIYTSQVKFDSKCCFSDKCICSSVDIRNVVSV